MYGVITGCATVYKMPELEDSGNNYKTIAILPFEVTVQYNRLPKNVTPEQIRENEYELGFVFQNQIDIYNLGEFSKDELARLLEVDEVISGHVITSKPMSTGAALAVGILFDIWDRPTRLKLPCRCTAEEIQSCCGNLIMFIPVALAAALNN